MAVLQGAGERVEVAYEPDRDDVRHLMSVWLRTSKTGRGLLVRFVLFVLVVVGFGAWMLSSGGISGSFVAEAALTGLFVFVITPWFYVRALRRRIVGRGPCRVVVEPAGITVAQGEEQSQRDWSSVTRYVETPERFLLLATDDRIASGVLLPKRGIREPGGADGLRALLDRHSRRV
ncbi:YcxB family protein [Streptomyces sp. NPDC002088]|uniref:YcxB family protein n=1 Tax=Streptomyces sp. NPDC002088 TaxID=3154665 RepID=UPI00331DB162